jgi:hypothetical protein
MKSGFCVQHVELHLLLFLHAAAAVAAVVVGMKEMHASGIFNNY